MRSNQNKKKNHHRLHTYTAELKCDVKASADDVIDYAVKIKDVMKIVMPLFTSMKKSTSLRCESSFE